MAKTILVTGSAGGIGSSVCKKFSSCGYRVIATDISENELQKLSSEKNVLTKRMDVTRVSQIQDVSNFLKENDIGLDGIVYAAGIFDMFPLVECDDSRFHAILNVNSLGLQRVIQITLPNLNDSAHVVTISSESSDLLTPFSLYALSKYWLEGISKVLRQELKLLGHHLTIVKPGAHMTPLYKGSLEPVAGADNSFFKKALELIPEMADKYASDVSDPDEIAELIFEIIDKKKEKRVYSINTDRKLALLRFMPQSWKETIFYKMLKKKLYG